MMSQSQVLTQFQEIHSFLESLSLEGGFWVLRDLDRPQKIVRVNLERQDQRLFFSGFTREGLLFLHNRQNLQFEAFLTTKKVVCPLSECQWTSAHLTCAFPKQIVVYQRREKERYYALSEFEMILKFEDTFFPILDLSVGGCKLQVPDIAQVERIREVGLGILILEEEDLPVQFKCLWQKKIKEVTPLGANDVLARFLLKQKNIQSAEQLQSIRASQYQMGCEWVFSEGFDRKQVQKLFQKLDSQKLYQSSI